MFKLAKSLFDLTEDVTRIVVAPVRTTADLADIVIKPIADTAEDAADVVTETKKDLQD